MEIFDQHLHSNFSFDSTEPLINYLANFPDNPIVTTEHLDYQNPAADFHDSVPDYAAYCREQELLRQHYGNRVYTGIEIGYTPAAEKLILTYLQAHAFNLRLLAVHQNGQFDFMQPAVKAYPVREVMRIYYCLLIEALESPVPADILAHFDYGLRQFDLTPATLLKTCGDLLDRVLDLVLKRNLVFELNTKSMYRYHHADLYAAVIDRYLDRGGRRFSIGSDAHSLQNYASHFTAARQLLLNKGVHQIVVFADQPRNISLD